MPAAVTYTFTNTEVADAAKFNTNYTDLVDAVNDFDGGTASNTQRLALPKAGTSTLNGLTRKEALIFYDTDEGKIKVDDGANLKAVGGGLVSVPTDETHSTDLESGKHYLVNCDGASADVTLNLPAGASEADIKVTVYNIPSTYKVIITPDGTEKIFYNDTDNATVEFVYAETEQWAEFIWNGTKWLVNDNSNVLSGTFSGSLAITGGLTISETATSPGSVVGNVCSGTYTPTISADGSGDVNFNSISAQPAQWLRVGNVVTVSGSFDAGRTSITGNQLAYISISIPIGANFSSIRQAGGTMCATDDPGFIYATPSSQTVTGGMFSTRTAVITIPYHFTYQVM